MSSHNLILANNESGHSIVNALLTSFSYACWWIYLTQSYSQQGLIDCLVSAPGMLILSQSGSSSWLCS